jgi:cytochrome c peroxidase
MPLILVSLSFAFANGAAFADQGRGKGPSQGKGKFPSAVRDSDFYDNGLATEEKIALGNFLFFDKELSGNRNISCATCHHSLTDTGDGLSLPVGEGGRGLGVMRDTGEGAAAVHERVPRNAPPVFNLGAKEFRRIFHDGRVEPDASQPSGFLNPAGDDLPLGLENVLAVQAMFPVTSATEMAGQGTENVIAIAAAAGNLAGPGGVWELLAQRLQVIPDYVDLFMAAYPGEITQASDITFVHAANAIAAFEAVVWRADKSPFDGFLRGDGGAMSPNQKKGMGLFYGSAGCYRCHSGTFQTDHDFHAIAMPQIGSGKGDGFMGREDFGRERVTGDAADRYRFRTPTLRNVALTAPYGHDGAYNTLEGVIRHHLNPVGSLESYDTGEAVLTLDPRLDPIDFIAHNEPTVRGAIAGQNELPPRGLSDRDVDSLIEFLRALTDPNSIDLRIDVPINVPSGLTIVE